MREFIRSRRLRLLTRDVDWRWRRVIARHVMRWRHTGGRHGNSGLCSRNQRRHRVPGCWRHSPVVRPIRDFIVRRRPCRRSSSYFVVIVVSISIIIIIFGDVCLVQLATSRTAVDSYWLSSTSRLQLYNQPHAPSSFLHQSPNYNWTGRYTVWRMKPSLFDKEYNKRAEIRHHHLISSNNGAETTIAKCAFRCTAPAIWNALPRTVLDSDTVTSFKSRLKTHLFSQAFSHTPTNY